MNSSVSAKIGNGLILVVWVGVDPTNPATFVIRFLSFRGNGILSNIFYWLRNTSIQRGFDVFCSL